MALATAFQFSVELSNVFPVKDVVRSASTALMDYARELRRGGSDIVVEEDLADIFGRGKITHELETSFKTKIMKKVTMVPLHPTSEIMLDPGPGATVTRAIRSENRKYLSTVIQLSMLCSMHSREDLATALLYCLNKRVELNVEGASPDPGYDGILGTLVACSSHSGIFPWSDYIRLVRQRFLTLGLCPGFEGIKMKPLPTSMLLNLMDFLYIVQSLPENRKLLLHVTDGLIPIIVWAHFILGLSVKVFVSSGINVIFGAGASPEVIIYHDRSLAENPIFTSNTAPENWEALMLDEESNIVLAPPEDDTLFIPVSIREQHPLEDYGTEILRRHLGRTKILPETDRVYLRIAGWVIRGLFLISKLRPGEGKIPCFELDRIDYRTPTIEPWRIRKAAKVIFRQLDIDLFFDSPDSEISGPSVSNDPWWGRNMREELHMHDPELSKRFIVFWFLVELVWNFAHVIKIEECCELPIVIAPSFPTKLVDFSDGGAFNPMTWQEENVFSAITAYVTANHSHSEGSLSDLVLLCENGWSVILTSIGDRDPGDIRPELLSIRRGVPFNSRTKERKSRIRDFTMPRSKHASHPSQRTSETRSFVPHCLTKVNYRKETHSSRPSEFWLAVRFAIASSTSQDHQPYESFLSYRNLNKQLSHVQRTKKCVHGKGRQESEIQASEPVRICSTIEAVDSIDVYDTRAPRIVVLFTNGDRQIRSLAIPMAFSAVLIKPAFAADCLIMLRTNDCCSECAVNHTCSIDNHSRWILIL